MVPGGYDKSSVGLVVIYVRLHTWISGSFFVLVCTHDESPLQLREGGRKGVEIKACSHEDGGNAYHGSPFSG